MLGPRLDSQFFKDETENLHLSEIINEHSAISHLLGVKILFFAFNGTWSE